MGPELDQLRLRGFLFGQINPVIFVMPEWLIVRKRAQQIKLRYSPGIVWFESQNIILEGLAVQIADMFSQVTVESDMIHLRMTTHELKFHWPLQNLLSHILPR